MESRNITLTLDKAQGFYNSGNEALKEIALQAFEEDELTSRNFKSFKSWKDIENYLADCDVNFNHDTKCMTRGQIALLKLNHIRKVLNNGKEMKLTEGDIYYPQIRFATKTSAYYDNMLERDLLVKVGTIKQPCGDSYNVFGGSADYSSFDGLGFFRPTLSVGLANAHIGFLGCARREIAEHMSRYFAREIFDAMYGDFVDYKWV